MSLRTYAVTAASMCCAALLLHLVSSASQPIPTLAPMLVAPLGCEPDAPVAVEILDSDVRHGRARIRYQVSPTIDIESVRVTLDLPTGATEMSHDRVDRGATSQGDSLFGSAVVRLPSGDSGGRITLRADVRFVALGDDGETGMETASTLRDLSWGSFDDPLDLATVTTDGIVSLEVPAVRSGANR